ncbi:hypothetical protein SDC9_38858 [bioreactor metagenome]|uniref:Beta-lactamase class A catalytic domain-containing protein n=1 Tax=bioreactor metagenome TaxID=1076179 RepID=A0A644VN59_9ZZZZ
MLRGIPVLFLCLFGFATAFSQDNVPLRDTSDITGKIIYQQFCDSFPELYMMPEWYKLQLIYVQVDRDKNGFPHLTYHKLGVDRKQYFYPASLVKPPTLMLTLEKLQRLKKYGVDKYTKLRIGKQHSCQFEFKTDTSGIEDYPCIANFIRRILLVSDNWSYNRLFEFVGQQELNDGLRRKGYPDPVILKRFARCDDDENRYTNPFWFYDDDGKVLLCQPQQENKKKYCINSCIDCKVGKGFKDGDKVIEQPRDFSNNNYLPLEDALQMLIAFIMPEAVDSQKRWDLSPQDRLFLLQYFSMYPRESMFSEYHNWPKYEDSYKKYFLMGDHKDTIYDSALRVFNIVGLSYGFSTDVAYVVNLREGVEFFLAGTIYTNQDEILNDETYEYRNIAFPFFGRFGRIIYDMERGRQKQYLPDFREIKQALSLPPM